METMKLTNQYISDDCTRKALVYVDANGHYDVNKYEMLLDGLMMRVGTRKFKHIESALRAVNKWIK